MGIKKIISVTLTILIIVSCRDTNKKMDFYEYFKTADLYRLPLVKPHELISANKGFNWFYKSNNFDVEVDSVGISESFIVIYSSSVYKPELGGRFEQWLIINHKTNETNIVNVSDEFKDFKNNNNFTMYAINEVYNVFNENLQLPAEWESVIKKR